ncbi:MAG: carbohydrate ABC transporter permease [Candidatus Hodarchaeales archaeon]
MNWRRIFKNSIIVGGLSFYLIIVIFPFYWLAFSSIKVLTDLFEPDVLFPWQTTLTLFNYEFAATKAYPSLISLFLNSLYISIISVLLTLIISTFGAYAVARMKFRGKVVVTNSILLIYTFPGIIMIIPIFVLASKLGLAANVTGLTIAYLAQTVPVALYMLAGYFQTIPAEIEEAALIDGCSRFEVISKITLPLSLPAIASISLFVFMIVWNEYLFARTFLLGSSSDQFTLAIGLARKTAHLADFGSYLASAMILLTPVIILYMLAEKYMVKGLTAGAVKG